MKAKHIELVRPYRFPPGNQPIFILTDIECQWQGGVLAIEFPEEVHHVPATHVHRVIMDRSELAKGKVK